MKLFLYRVLWLCGPCRRRICSGLLVFLVVPVWGLAAGDEFGALEGRVFNAQTGAALANVRVTVEGTNRVAVTDETGTFRIFELTGGVARLTLSYVGFKPESAVVTVTPAKTLTQDFNLTFDSPAALNPKDTVQLSQFTVVEDRQMSAQAVSMNERRNAPNIKDVVAIDEFGDRGNENIGEFLQFLPGVSIGTSGTEASSISLRGFPGNNTEITIDGGQLTSARNTNSRGIDLRTAPMNNISRVEVTKVPTPDLPASGLGGSINLISRNGFESREPLFTYNLYTSFHNRMGISYDGGRRNEVPSNTPKFVQPSFDFSYLRPLNKNLAITVGFSHTWREKPMETGFTTDETATWDLVNGIQRTSQWNSLAQITQTLAGQVGVDWRLSDENTLSASFQYRDYQLYTTRSVMIFNYGAGVTGNDRFSQGASTGVGTSTMQSGPDSLPQDNTKHYTVRFKHRGQDWSLDASGSYSDAASKASDISRGHFYQTTTTLSNLVIRGDGIPTSDGILPTRYTAVDRTGAAVDLFNGDNYPLISTQSAETQNNARRMTGRLDLTRSFRSKIPWSLKTGIAIDRSDRDENGYTTNWSFQPNGATDTTSRLAKNFDVFDAAYNAEAPNVYGQSVKWISGVKTYQLYQAHPTWFVLDAPGAWQNYVNGSRRFTEVISAGYLRSDVRLFSNRLWIVAGARYERTSDNGNGPLNQVSAQYARNPDGSFALDSAGQRVLLTTDPLALRKLQFQRRGAHNQRDYSDIYPSINATFNLRENLVLRGAYARTLGRPNLSFIVPGTTITDPTVALPTITVNNTALKPWTADNFDLSLESYQIKDGFGSIGFFHKTISNFFGTLNTPATAALLDQYGLGGDPSLLNYTIATRVNAGDATITGFEFGYRQSLTFLPAWAKGFQLFANATKLELKGSNTADFSGFNPESVAGGVSFVRSRYFLKGTVTYTGETKGALSAVNLANGIPAGTYAYQGKRARWAANAQYSLTKSIALYATVNDIGGFVQNLRLYAPNTPDYAKNQRRQELGFYTTLGVRGSF